MDDHGDRTALMSALVTEHFVLQSRASSTISESSSRSTLYLLSLSSSLVALGFATQSSEQAFAPFAAALLPTMFLLGLFTVVRLCRHQHRERGVFPWHRAHPPVLLDPRA